MFVVNCQNSPDSIQYSVCAIEKNIATYFLLQVDLFPFHYVPKCFNDIQVWRIGLNINIFYCM